MVRKTSGCTTSAPYSGARSAWSRPRRRHGPGDLAALLLALLLALAWPGKACGQTSGSSNRDTRNAEYNAEKRKKAQAKADYPRYPLWNGLEVAVDLWAPGARLLGGDNTQGEVAIAANLHNRYFPIVELGYGKSDTWGDDGIHYESHGAPFFRIGIDYNALYKKAHGHMILVGLRYGFTSFKYDIEQATVTDEVYGGTIGNPNLEDDYWGDASLPYSHLNMKGRLTWIEVVLGIRAHLTPRFYMGWSLRMKYKQSATTGTYGNPQSVPGYGKYGGSTMGVTYTLTYKLFK